MSLQERRLSQQPSAENAREAPHGPVDSVAEKPGQERLGSRQQGSPEHGIDSDQEAARGGAADWVGPDGRDLR